MTLHGFMSEDCESVNLLRIVFFFRHCLDLFETVSFAFVDVKATEFNPCVVNSFNRSHGYFDQVCIYS